MTPDEHKKLEQSCDEIQAVVSAAFAFPAEEARAYLEHAEDIAKELQENQRSMSFASAVTEIAKAWIKLFGDVRHAHMILGLLQTPKETAGDLIVRAHRMREVFGEVVPQEMRGVLLQAEEFAENSSEWSSCSRTWRCLLDDLPRARYCWSRAEETAHTVGDYSSCAYACRDLCDAEEGQRIRGYATKAMKLVAGMDDWFTVARIWHSTEDSSGLNHARQCLLRAEEFSTTPDDWATCAQQWDSLFHGSAYAEVVRCMNFAEGLSGRNWLSVILTWYGLFSIRPEWTPCDYEPDVLLEYQHRYEQSVQRFEALRPAIGDWLDVALQMLMRNSSYDQCERFMLKAEALATTKGDWLNCSSIWSLSTQANHRENALVCKKRAVQLPATGGHVADRK